MDLNIIVIGLGSMGKRRIRLLKQISNNIKIFGVDTNKERQEEVEKEFNIKGYDSIKEAVKSEKIDAAVISTSPLSHNNIIKECLEHNLHIFTELNLVEDGYEENIKLAKKKEKILFLSSTFLYRKEIEYISEKINDTKTPVNYIYHVGQYLPDWHPWENFKDFFVNEKRTNGCRELFAVELPWIVRTFGEIKDLNAVKDKISTLEVNYPDNFITMLEHTNGNKGVLVIDIVSRKAVRNLEIFGEEIHLTWKGTPDSLFDFDIKSKKEININLYEKIDKLNEYSANIIEDAYKDELINFINSIFGKENPKYSFEEDKKILKIIDSIEK